MFSYSYSSLRSDSLEFVSGQRVSGMLIRRSIEESVFLCVVKGVLFLFLPEYLATSLHHTLKTTILTPRPSAEGQTPFMNGSFIDAFSISNKRRENLLRRYRMKINSIEKVGDFQRLLLLLEYAIAGSASKFSRRSSI